MYRRELVFCPRCASIQDKKDNVENDTCFFCETPLIDSGIFEEAEEAGSSIHYERRRHIFETMIEPMGQLAKDSKEYKDNYYAIYHLEEDDRKILEIYGEIHRQQQEKLEHIPTCPTCGSAHVRKISTGSKVGAAALIGIFALGHIGKTFECLNCGMKW